MNVSFTGVAAHSGSCAQLGRNALMAACTASMQIMGIPRHGQGETNVNVGVLNAGEGRNIVPVHAKMEFEVRGANKAINDYMQESAERMVKGAAESYGVDYKIELAGMATTVSCDKQLTDIMEDLAHKAPGVKRVFNIMDCPGSEDCSLLMQKVQSHGGEAAFFMFGCNHPGHHLKNFQIQDKESMPVALSMFTGAIAVLNAQ